MQTLAVDRQRVRGRGNDGLQLVCQGAALAGVRLFQLVDDKNFALKVITPRRRHAVIIDKTAIAKVRPADRPDERCPERVLAGAFVAPVQHGVVDLDARVLHLERHHVPKMLKLFRLFNKRAAVVDPRRDIARRILWPSVAPTVRVDKTVTRHQHVIARCVCQADKRRRAHGLPVLVEANRRLDAAGCVDGLAGDVAEDGVESVTRNFAAVDQVEIGVVCLDVGEPFVPVRLFKSPHLFAFDLFDHPLSFVRKRCRWLNLRQCQLHPLCDEVVAEAVPVFRPAFFCDPREEARAVPVAAVRVEADISAVDGVVSAHRVAVRVFFVVRADDADPAFRVCFFNDFSPCVHPS